MSFEYFRAKKKKSKDKSMVAHCKKRFYQRFGFELTDNMIENMIAQITKRKSKFVSAQSCSRTVHIVKVNEVSVVVIYNKNKRLIHTCFPEKWLYNGTYEEYLKKQEYING